jgi:hypothetical protein
MPERPSRSAAEDGIQIIAEAGRDAHAGDDDATHQKLPVSVNRPTRRSRAVDFAVIHVHAGVRLGHHQLAVDDG